MDNTEPVLEQRYLIDRGAFSWVISNRQRALVYKLFKRNSHPDYAGEDSFDDQRNIEVFRSECEAYKLVQTREHLSIRTPQFFGCMNVKAVLDLEGNDISSQFLLECCLCLELVQGTAQKLNPVLERFEYLQHFISELHAAGVNYTLDASVFSPKLQTFKVIDFATRNAALEYEIAHS